jgi:hypothetical protein
LVVSPLAKKLQIKPGYRVRLVNAPTGMAELLEPLPDGAETVQPDEILADVLLTFVRDAGELAARAPQMLPALKPDGLLWICYPKGGRKAGTDLNRDILWQLMGSNGLTGVSLVAVDDIWSAMRFRHGVKPGV